MNITPKCLLILLGCWGSALSLAAAPTTETPAEKSAPPSRTERSGLSNFLNDLLPTAWQKNPKIRFNVYTEMTPAGRERPVPTADKPFTYFSLPGTYQETGWNVSAGEKPPPWKDLEEAMRNALANNGYVATTDDKQRPNVLIVFNYGMHATDIGQLATDDVPVNAEELMNYAITDGQIVKDVIERARFIGGPKVADELYSALRMEAENSRFNATVSRGGGTALLPVNPDFASPFQVLLHGSDSEATQNVVELAFHTCYFVTATAYDFTGVEKKQKMPLWQTRMTVEAQGTELREVLRPLIINAGAYLGRETPEAKSLDQRIDRTGHVEIGEAKVIDDNAKPATTDTKSGKR